LNRQLYSSATGNFVLNIKHVHHGSIGKIDCTLGGNGLPHSVLEGKRETSDIYATLDFLPKKEAQTNVVFAMIWMTNYERRDNKMKRSRKTNA
jgi:hypothetical protein